MWAQPVLGVRTRRQNCPEVSFLGRIPYLQLYAYA